MYPAAVSRRTICPVSWNSPPPASSRDPKADTESTLVSGVAPTDSVCMGVPLAYARYGDDIRVFFADRAAALSFMPRLVQAMRQLGLNLAAAKTEIVPAMQLAVDFEADRRAAAAYGVENQMVDSLNELREIFDASVDDPANVNQSDFTFALWRLIPCFLTH